DAPRPEGGVTIGPALPTGSGNPRQDEARPRKDAFRSDPESARSIIAEAAAELAAGLPAYALTVGTELHWLDGDQYRSAGLDLLSGAYRALGRDALAEIAEVHAANRDPRSVEVLVQAQ